MIGLEMQKWQAILSLSIASLTMLVSYSISQEDRYGEYVPRRKNGREGAAEASTRRELADLPNRALPPAAAEESPDIAEDLKDFHADLYRKTIHDLTQLSFMDRPCSQINCRNIKNEKAAKIISGVITQKQTEVSMSSGNQQGWSAIGSLIVSIISLVISIITSARQYLSSKSQRKPQPLKQGSV